MDLLIVIVNYRSRARDRLPAVARARGRRDPRGAGGRGRERLGRRLGRPAGRRDPGERLGRGPNWWSPPATAGSPPEQRGDRARPWRRPTRRDYVWLLNPDTIVRPGALRALVEFMDGRPDVGLAGSRLEDPDGTPQRSAFRFPTVLGELEGGLRLGPVSRLLDRHVVAPAGPRRASARPTGWPAPA